MQKNVQTPPKLKSVITRGKQKIIMVMLVRENVDNFGWPLNMKEELKIDVTFYPTMHDYVYIFIESAM